MYILFVEYVEDELCQLRELLFVALAFSVIKNLEGKEEQQNFFFFS